MFTGIIERRGRVASCEPMAAGCRIVIDAGGWPPAPVHGESISVNGCCLTLVTVDDGGLVFEAVPQTLARTTLGEVMAGDPVNLERSMRVDALLGGHLVQGHVDAVGQVISVDRSGGGWRTRISAPAELDGLLVDRGSVAVDGVSLTVAACAAGWFEVALIPETLARTTLVDRVAGSRVNLEGDALAKLVAAQVRRQLAGLSAPAAPAR